MVEKCLKAKILLIAMHMVVSSCVLQKGLEKFASNAYSFVGVKMNCKKQIVILSRVNVNVHMK